MAGSTLYGTTAGGGGENLGTIFRIGTDGSGYEILHSFTVSLILSFFAVRNDGAYPTGPLVLSGSAIYGAATGEGLADMGTIFRIDTHGSRCQLLHTFGSSPRDGQAPSGLILLGSTLYGATALGGAYPINMIGKGTIFRIGTDGGGYRILHSFGGAAEDGAIPNESSLASSGTALYGTTREGGAHNFGTIFRIDTDGGGYQILYSFKGSSGDGAKPAGSLSLSGSTLYGTTMAGGAYNGGTIFRINTDGSGYQLLHSFNPASDGAMPWGAVTLAGTTLYGMTSKGGANNYGTIFSFNLAP